MYLAKLQNDVFDLNNLISSSIPKRASYELIYFDARGRAELVRWVFAAAGQDYKDTRLTQEQWTAMKEDTKYEQLPELRVGGKVLTQCNSIARFLAREFGLAGKDSFEQGEVDMYVDMCNELHQQLFMTLFIKDEAIKKQQMKEVESKILPKFLSFIERDLGNNGGEYLVGNSLTLADLAVQNLLDGLCPSEPSAAWGKKYPNLKANRDAVRSVPNMKEYLKNQKGRPT